MSATYRLFSKWAELKNYRSAMAACEALGVTRASATNWKNGKNAEAQVIAKMASDLGENPAAWVLAAAAEKAKADEQRTLLALAKKLGYAAAMLLAVFTSIDPAIADSRPFHNERDGRPPSFLHKPDTICIAHVYDGAIGLQTLLAAHRRVGSPTADSCLIQ